MKLILPKKFYDYKGDNKTKRCLSTTILPEYLFSEDLEKIYASESDFLFQYIFKYKGDKIRAVINTFIREKNKKDRLVISPLIPMDSITKFYKIFRVASYLGSFRISDNTLHCIAFNASEFFCWVHKDNKLHKLETRAKGENTAQELYKKMLEINKDIEKPDFAFNGRYLNYIDSLVEKPSKVLNVSFFMANTEKDNKWDTFYNRHFTFRYNTYTRETFKSLPIVLDKKFLI